MPITLTTADNPSFNTLPLITLTVDANKPSKRYFNNLTFIRNHCDYCTRKPVLWDTVLATVQVDHTLKDFSELVQNCAE